MKLFFSPGACSLAVNISLREAGLKFEGIKVDLRAKKAGTEDYLKINRKGYVPALQLDNGQVMTEGVAIMQWAADHATAKNLLPAWGTQERYKGIEWLNFIATELHKGMSPLWNPEFPAAAGAISRERVQKRFELVEEQLQKTNFLMGDHFTVCDAYLFTMIQWTPGLKVDMSKCPKTMAFHERIKARPTVQEALAMETAK